MATISILMTCMRFGQSNAGLLAVVAASRGVSPPLSLAFGGVTRDLLLQADRCALVSH